MAEAAVGAIIEVMLGKLLTLAEEQISLVRHFKDDLKKLQGSLTIVQAFLHDAEKKQVTHDSVKVWLRQLEDLAFDADNIIDEIDYELLSKKAKPTENKTSVNEKVQSCFSCCSIFVKNKTVNETGYENHPISYRREMGRRIKDINERLDKINQLATASRLVKKLDSAQDRLDAYENREENAFAVDPIFLGRENEVSEIVKMLTTTGPAGQKSYVLPIVGMGGQGKTTIAREVFHDERILSHFGDKNRVWVYVSENFDVRKILKNILTSITTTEKFELETQQDILKKLQEHWGAKKYLLVLDDVWKKNLIPGKVWDDFVNSLSGISCNGYCMIVTTRSEEVASVVKTLDVHNLEGLPENDCWSIIKAKAFRGGEIPFDVEEIGKNIAKKCQGLPLAAKVVGGLLYSMKSKDEWSSIDKNWLSNPEDEKHISNVLKLSFDHLSSPSLKKCFSYCSIFRKGYEIKKERLVELWMAEGFLQTNHQKGNNNIDMETIGNNNFSILLRNSLLQHARSDEFDNVTHCSMHDLVHDLAYSILHENDDATEGVCKSRYIGYKPGGDGLSSIPKGQEGYVRTLFFDGKVSDIKFSDFESLHTLTLVGKDIDYLPTSIRKLKHLRYLDISETRISCLSDSISELYHLQTLRAGMWWGNVEKLMPDSFSCLISLRHLHISYNTILSPEIGNLTSLQTLPYFRVGGETGCGISELGKLKYLNGKLEICNLEKVHDNNEAASADLIRKLSIHEIKLVWDRSREGDETNDESVLEGLEPHPNLKKIEIRGYKGKSLPLWTSNIALQLMKIELIDCSELVELPSLGQLRYLKYLCLSGLKNVKSIRPSFYGIDNCTYIVVFPALKSLELKNMTNMKEWDEAGRDLPSEVVVFPCLKYLKIQRCGQLMRAPRHFPCLKNLEIGEMESGLALGNICGMKLTTLTHLSIRQIQGLECLPDGLFSNNHNLSKVAISDCPKMTYLIRCFQGDGPPSSLRELLISECRSLSVLPDDLYSLNSLEKLVIRNCPSITHLVPFLRGENPLCLKVLEIHNCSSLRELPDDLQSLNSLEKLVIRWCPDLKSIPYPSSRGGQQQQGFTSLKELTIGGCNGLTNLPIEMLESCALSLERLSLNGSSSLTNVSEVIECCLHKMTRLTSLYIHGVPKFSIISSAFQLHLKMEHLEMSPSPSDCSWNNVSFNETVDAMLLRLITSLRQLNLHGMEDWECLPDGIQHLTSLRELSLWTSGIEAVPEWFGNFSSLEKLSLIDCRKLATLPSKQATQRLSKLKTLSIHLCPLLLKEERRYNYKNSKTSQIVDSEWPKISHIPTINVEFRPYSHHGH